MAEQKFLGEAGLNVLVEQIKSKCDGPIVVNANDEILPPHSLPMSLSDEGSIPVAQELSYENYSDRILSNNWFKVIGLGTDDDPREFEFFAEDTLKYIWPINGYYGGFQYSRCINTNYFEDPNGWHRVYRFQGVTWKDYLDAPSDQIISGEIALVSDIPTDYDIKNVVNGTIRSIPTAEITTMLSY